MAGAECLLPTSPTLKHMLNPLMSLTTGAREKEGREGGRRVRREKRGRRVLRESGEASRDVLLPAGTEDLQLCHSSRRLLVRRHPDHQHPLGERLRV